MNILIREIFEKDYILLEEFLYNAIYVPPCEEPPPKEVIFDPEIYIYIDGFGNKPGDCGVVAEHDGKITGMAWTRIIPAYGHIDDNTPELAISVLPELRGQNIGTLLMTKLFELLCVRGYKRTSLSVQKDNPAARFYQRLGYVITSEKLDHVGWLFASRTARPCNPGHEDYIMVKDLGRHEDIS